MVWTSRGLFPCGQRIGDVLLVFLYLRVNPFHGSFRKSRKSVSPREITLAFSNEYHCNKFIIFRRSRVPHREILLGTRYV